MSISLTWWSTSELIGRLDALITQLGGPVTDAIENLPGITIPVNFDVQNPETFQGAFTWVWPQLPLPQAANGGVFTKPTVALIGEAGPEAVIPLNQLGGRSGVTVNIDARGALLNDPGSQAQLADLVSDALTRQLSLRTRYQVA